LQCMQEYNFTRERASEVHAMQSISQSKSTCTRCMANAAFHKIHFARKNLRTTIELNGTTDRIDTTKLMEEFHVTSPVHCCFYRKALVHGSRDCIVYVRTCIMVDQFHSSKQAALEHHIIWYSCEFA
jgi:hypothetical protein